MKNLAVCIFDFIPTAGSLTEHQSKKESTKKLPKCMK